MDNQECPWEIIKNVARDSVRRKENTRFYLQTKDDVYCSNVAIFVGNLPPNLQERQYERILVDLLGKRESASLQPLTDSSDLLTVSRFPAVLQPTSSEALDRFTTNTDP